MSGKTHEWLIYIVDKHGFPRSIAKDFEVKSPTILGAAMKANKIIKKEHEGWIVQRIWWLDPKRSKRGRR
tara:strand:+ start:1151 stop:1360 length:210 start_codon:yes stop_codon:yes gene_type:complete